MPTIRKSLLIIFLSLFCLGMASLPRRPSIIKGKVTDSRTNQPLVSAQIKLVSLLGQLKASALTDTNGNYELRNLSFPRYGSFYILKVSKSGYSSQSIRRFFTNNRTYSINFRLHPKPTPNHPPNIKSITPADNSTFLAGAKIDIQINAYDPDKDPLEYQFSIGGAIKQAWSSSKTYSWQTFASDTGAVGITCEAKDPKGLTASKTITYHIINPTVEEILQKVADNYALVDDKKMDVTMTSKFNTEAFGETIYTRHYFMKPDKQRTDTFPKEDRADSSKTEIQITVGPDTYLIDPLSNAQSHRNILEELNLTQEQLNQMDEICHLQDFLKAHTIVRKDTPTDLTNGFIMLEAIPKIEHKIYSKLGIQLDYFKGIKTKSLTYLKENNQDKLKQAIEITNTRKMPNGAWVPKAQVKTLYLSEGNLIMTSDFKNIQINTGLPDYLFDPTKQ